MALEDLTTYTLVDPASDYTVTVDRVASDTANRDTTAKVYDDKGAAFFNGDFIHQFDSELTSSTTGSSAYWLCNWLMADVVSNYIDIVIANGDCLSTFFHGSGTTFYLREVDGGVEYQDTWTFTEGITYYFEVERDETVGTYGTIYCRIYSDSARTTLLVTLNVALNSSKKDYRYIYTASSPNTSSGDSATGWAEKYELNIAAGGVIKTISEIGFGADALDIAVNQSVAEIGTGNDGFPPLSASVNTSDIGSGTDALILSSLHAISESGIGSESLNISPLITVVDNGLGVDGLTLAISVSLSDSGTGQDNLSVLTSILKVVADSGQGSDLISQVSAQYSISETAKGIDQTILSVLLSLSEAATGFDSVSAITTIIKKVLENATGSDSVSATVSVSIEDVASGAEALLLNSLLALVETGLGLDVVNNFDSSSRITTITFSL
ncbi:MAG: hypothetical protein GXP14_11330, partial [Gammaproteobacteria bacterium]|nr:hypothetical protein [Gammaproteobacteria bacterium]